VIACISLAVACSALAGQDNGDPIKNRLDQARATFEKDNEKAKADLLAQLDLKLEAVQKTGDLSLLKKLRAEREAFADADESPKSVSPMGYKAALKKSAERLSASLTQGRKEYTQAGKIAEAEVVDAEIAEFSKSGGTRPVAGVPPKLGRVAPNQVRVISATWGAGNRNADVTERVAALLAQGRPVVVDGPVLGTDPAPNVSKTMRLRLQVGEQVLELTIPDRGELRLSPGR